MSGDKTRETALFFQALVIASPWRNCLIQRAGPKGETFLAYLRQVFHHLAAQAAGA